MIAQTVSIRGIVLDAISKEPLEGVTIYMDGTTYGTITNTHGKFSLEYEKSNNIKAIISYLGYETIILETSSIQEKEILKVYIEKKREELEEVYLQNDHWTREKKLKYFRKHFIGDEKDQKFCKILNEDDIHLHYDAQDRILYASAWKPIEIKNNSLGYTIFYNLMDFEIKFAAEGWFDSFYFAGTSYFMELNPDKIKKFQRKRRKFYRGSILHFMRSLRNQTLAKNKFELYYKGLKSHPDKLFKFEKRNNYVIVSPLKKRISILFEKRYQTELDLKVNDFFEIDIMGNFSPLRGLVFSGFMANQRMAKLLPLDYAH